MKEEKKVEAKSSLLVGAGQSSRLAAIRNKAQQQNNNLKNKSIQIEGGLKSETKEALEQAINLIEEKLAAILNNYPPAKKNTFFKLKYGVEIKKIKLMAMKEIFFLLHLDRAIIRHFRVIENLNFTGKKVCHKR